MNINDERPEDEIKDDQILASILAHRLKLSLRVIASAQSLAWADLPVNEKRAYMRHAEQALRGEIKAS